MAINIKNGIDTYYGKDKINIGDMLLELVEFGTIATPTETLEISENGTFDVTNYAKAIINVNAGSGSESHLIKRGEIVLPTSGYYIRINHEGGKVPLFFLAKVPSDTTPAVNNVSKLLFIKDTLTYRITSTTVALDMAIRQTDPTMTIITDEEAQSQSLSKMEHGLYVSDNWVVVNSDTTLFYGVKMDWVAVYEV